MYLVTRLFCITEKIQTFILVFQCLACTSFAKKKIKNNYGNKFNSWLVGNNVPVKIKLQWWLRQLFNHFVKSSNKMPSCEC